MIETALTIFFLLLCGHALADFALQNEWVATNKNRHARLIYTPDEQDKMEKIWPWLLTAHSLHHGLMVFIFTQKPILGLAETVVHWITDYGKSEKWFGFSADQFIHILTKAVWVALLYFQIV